MRCTPDPSVFAEFEEINQAVVKASGPVVVVDDRLIDEVVTRARQAPKKRARALLHPSQDDSLHEMVIALPQDSCDVPHINYKSGKSFHLVQGEMAVMIFSDDGQKVTSVRLGGDSDRRLVRLNRPYWHTIIPLTDYAVFIETIIGPFSGNRFAEWAPLPEDAVNWPSFVRTLREFATSAS